MTFFIFLGKMFWLMIVGFPACAHGFQLPHFISIFTSWLFALQTSSSSMRHKDSLADCVACFHNCVRPTLCNKPLIKYMFLLLVLLLWGHHDRYKGFLCAWRCHKPTANNSCSLHSDALRWVWTGTEDEKLTQDDAATKWLIRCPCYIVR